MFAICADFQNADSFKFNKSENSPIIIGVISDTHGSLVPAAVKVLKAADLIIHAGDIDTPDVLKSLRNIAPVVAVKGNMDKGRWAFDLKATETIQVGKVSLCILHDIMQLDLKPAGNFHAVISGHTHRAFNKTQNGVLFLNPGSASLPKHNLPATVAVLSVNGTSLNVEFKEL